MNDVIGINVFTPRQFITALRLSQNLFLKRSVISVLNYGNAFPKRQDLIPDLQYGVKNLFSQSAGSFAGAQLSQYTLGVSSDPFYRNIKITIDAEYFCSSKEYNDLVCICAEIAVLLNRKVRNPNDNSEKIRVFDRWVKKHFVYKDTNSREDYQAIGLLKNRRGVCQAIAAITVLILSYMGIEVLFVSGVGFGEGGWGGHAWNAIKVDNKWVQVDFTFSLDSIILPSTKTRIEERAFTRTHRWDQSEFNELAFESKMKSMNWLYRASSTLEIAGNSLVVDGATVVFTHPLVNRIGSSELIDLSSIVRLLGGGIEVDPNNGTINICACSNRIEIRNAMRHFCNGYFDKSIVDCVWKSEWSSASKLLITL